MSLIWVTFVTLIACSPVAAQPVPPNPTPPVAEPDITNAGQEFAVSIKQKQQDGKTELTITWTGNCDPAILAVVVERSDADRVQRLSLLTPQTYMGPIVPVRRINQAGSVTLTIIDDAISRLIQTHDVRASAYVARKLRVQVHDALGPGVGKRLGKILRDEIIDSNDCADSFRVVCYNDANIRTAFPGLELWSFPMPKKGGFEVSTDTKNLVGSDRILFELQGKKAKAVGDDEP